MPMTTAKLSPPPNTTVLTLIRPRRCPSVSVSLHRRDVARHVSLASLVLTVETQCRSGHHSVVGHRATPTARCAVTMAWACAMPAQLGWHWLIWPPGQAGATRPWANFDPCNVQSFSIFKTLFLLKFLEICLSF
jgi:hypothetical protein